MCRFRWRPGRADFDTVRQAWSPPYGAGLTGGSWGQSVLRAQLGALIFGVEGVENYALHRPGRCGGSGGRAATTGHTDGSGTGGTA